MRFLRRAINIHCHLIQDTLLSLNNAGYPSVFTPDTYFSRIRYRIMCILCLKPIYGYSPLSCLLHNLSALWAPLPFIKEKPTPLYLIRHMFYNKIKVVLFFVKQPQLEIGMHLSYLHHLYRHFMTVQNSQDADVSGPEQ